MAVINHIRQTGNVLSASQFNYEIYKKQFKKDLEMLYSLFKTICPDINVQYEIELLINEVFRKKYKHYPL